VDSSVNPSVLRVSTFGRSVFELTASTPPPPPAAARIVFASNRDGDNEIYSMDPDGSGVTQLTTNTSDDIEPVLSRDGTKIAFATNRDGNYNIYTMNADGTGVKQLTKDDEDHMAIRDQVSHPLSWVAESRRRVAWSARMLWE
jgi:Tol biopolymer transport system component